MLLTSAIQQNMQMVRSDGSEYLGIYYGKIMQISRAYQAKGGRTKLQNPTSMH
jgi:hypothetical protein